MLNMQLDRLAIVDTASMDWEASPAAGVWRKPLERAAAEHGRATSVVRYDAGSRFAEHAHPLGEEILVLDGVFADNHGEYPAGTYLRSPPGSRHAPRSDDGCSLLVKLDQFAAGDDTRLCIDTNTAAWMPGECGIAVMPLHYYDTEMTALYRWPAGTRYDPHSHFGGEEVFVLSGRLADDYGEYPAGSWMRYPHNSEHSPLAEVDTVIWIKTGHLLP